QDLRRRRPDALLQAHERLAGHRRLVLGRAHARARRVGRRQPLRDPPALARRRRQLRAELRRRQPAHRQGRHHPPPQLAAPLPRAPGESVAGSPYAIHQGSLDAGANYALSFVGANLTIAKADPTLHLSWSPGAYDGSAQPASASTSGVAGASLADPSLTYYRG